jgi:hypothetical protein
MIQMNLEIDMERYVFEFFPDVQKPDVYWVNTKFTNFV